MAEEPEDNNSNEEYDESSIDEEEGPDYNANVLRGSRWLFQRAEGEYLDDDVDTDSDEEEDDDDRSEVEPRAPVDYIVEKLVQRGVTMADMVKSILVRDHDEYQFHDEFERVDDNLFGKFRIIISNFQPPAPAIQVQAVAEQHQSSRLRPQDSDDDSDDDSNDSDELEEVDRNQIHYERFTKYYDSYYSSERMTRYEKMSALVEECRLEEKENNSSVRMPFSFQMKGSCVIAKNGLK
jgi:hypothetical protein